MLGIPPGSDGGRGRMAVTCVKRQEQGLATPADDGAGSPGAGQFSDVHPSHVGGNEEWPALRTEPIGRWEDDMTLTGVGNLLTRLELD